MAEKQSQPWIQPSRNRRGAADIVRRYRKTNPTFDSATERAGQDPPLRFTGEGDAVPAGAFNAVHSLVSGSQKLLRGAAVGREPRYSVARGHPNVLSVRGEEHTRVKRLLEAPDHHQRVLLRGLRQEENKLVPAIAKGGIDYAQVALDQLADPPQDLRAYQVPVGIIDVFEPIEVHEDEGELVPEARGAVDFSLEHLIEMPGV